MTHLVRTTQKSLFETTVAGRRDSEVEEGGLVARPFAPPAPAPLSVSPVTTPEDARMVNRAQYPQYDWLSVENLEPRMRGKHY